MASSSWKKWPNHERDKWRDDLRDIDFWFNGYRETPAYNRLAVIGHCVHWNVGVGPMVSFTRAISGMAMETISNNLGEFKPVIKVDLKPTPTAEEAQGRGIMSTKYQLALAAAKELGLLDQYYNVLKERQDELLYYTYGSYDGGTSSSLESHMRQDIVPQIIKQLITAKYLLVAENLQWPIEPGSFTLEDAGLRPPLWGNSRWIISTTSHDAYKKSKSKNDGVISIDKDDQVVVLILYALHQSAEHILRMIRQESKEYWHRIALMCFHYAMAIFAKHSQVAAITSDELINHWAAQGILPCMAIKEEEETNTISSKCSNVHRVGRVILEAFQKYSLLQLPFSLANEAYEATSTGAQFLVYHGLVAEGITVDELFDNKKKWISFNGDNGCHVSREWLCPEETSGSAALILRGCSHQSLILSKLNSFLPKLCFLRVLDISYTPIKALPYSIGFLTNLRLLCLRGCHGLKTLSCSSTTSATYSSTNISSYSPLSTLYLLEILDMNGVPCSHLTQDMANQKINLIYLDMSYSEITTFPPTFFEDMSNLEELILVSCANLVDLPPSMAALSSLTTLEVTGTRIKYFPLRIFEEMRKLQSLKLIDNKDLISLTGPISRLQGITLEGHPRLISFVLIGAPHIKRLSLRGCRNLESVEIMNLCALEELDLSGTAIKDLPADVPNFPQLRRLLLLGVPSLRRFPWHRLVRLPEVFYLDHCSEENGNHCNQVSQVCVTDPRFFHSFNNTLENLVRDGRFFQSFYVRVAPCITNSMRVQDEEAMLDSKLQELSRKRPTYEDVYNSCYVEKIATTSPITLPLQQTVRHMEITGMQQTHRGLPNLLNVTKSISVTFDSSIRIFHSLSDFIELEECELRWCHKMEGIVYHILGWKKLRNMHVCNLKRLVSFCSEYSYSDFGRLEHLHLEDCPRLEHVVPHTATLPCLKTLDILFCYKLKTIFITYRSQGNTYQLPSLQRIRLQELPLLQHFHDNDATTIAPVWKELHIRGCWSLRCLPRLQGRQPETVKVNGERSWWSKLQWGSPLHRNSYDPKLPPQVASFDERAEMSSYLR
ncbi:hypothetical protein CFC21_000284 [Triticum aestivum]|uniref:Disease resistance protein At4g27190-like leucine-rich repeats domain-containing protein n=1 Tax=Triticum aestivum TaxID=4565 RepID=A0A3B5XTT1_WHEAT|nr:uncharacterized protein LOC123185916 [Triticum aestivum]XP_044453670.1 uncharacterized protein LOC123185916 [Triticum aestivum]KAF6981831.1 hypothetical protein CFC21_000284 [Triticum aestivum]